MFILRESLVGSGDNVHISLVRQSHQLPPGSMVVVTCHDDQRRWKVYRLYMTLGILFHINCIVAGPHVSWPHGTFWLVELMLQLYDPWVSHWISVFWVLVFIRLLIFPFHFFQTSNHYSEFFLLRSFSVILLWFFSVVLLRLVHGRTFYISFWEEDRMTAHIFHREQAHSDMSDRPDAPTVTVNSRCNTLHLLHTFMSGKNNKPLR